MQNFFKQHKKSLLYGLGACVLVLVIYGYTETQDLPNGSNDSSTTPVSLGKVDNTPTSIDQVFNTQEELAGSAEQDTFYETIVEADDPTPPSSNQYREDVLEESFYSSLLPLFEFDFKIDSKRKAALDVFVSKMPEGLSQEELINIAQLVNEHIPGEPGLLLGEALVRLYELNVETEALLKSVSPPGTEQEFIELRTRLENLRTTYLGHELALLMDGRFQSEDDDFTEEQYIDDSETLSTVGDMVEKLSAEGLAEDQIFNQVAFAYGDDAADNYQELKDVQKHWMERYQNYLDEKRIIMEAGLDRHEKSRQIEDLLATHYGVNELQAAKAFDELMSTQTQP